MAARKKKRPAPLKRTRRKPKLDPKAVELVRWYFAVEGLRHE